ncbi:MAG TPA: ABC transporter ATP-binding protein [Cyanobacteria bacterium UBA11149]|nr:ABC transporter ATP-binding protein [Cyanobacteria bacterium UBA11367]HBE55981.1 ABC transporter ATP-binding protein [Cyanobacteria bacterium UBA11366]HBK63209.1 ABC transporter ATP-binding protein [Cyanobacteria bacterium UBA11166]HBR74555.1 ABC transporter ATP-binding protein [Cyanobacteria bacterium UBA11159]HBS67900.1 ABC transporter ATP-binding protein [Cyanobacteria bacterium UBA11153]HBW91928.1 ABC transporter ATP-binding protein [Cyanobacteria bacterium UBA11149]HCA94746.1 ABC tran
MNTATETIKLELTKPPELEVVNMTKKFGTFTALDNVSIHLKPGKFHALLGENGAGKSTLVKCIMGFYKPTSGEVLIDKQNRTIESPRDAHKHGIGMVYQHFTSVPAMNVAENLVLSKFDSPNLIKWKDEYQELNAFMENSPFQIPLNIPVSQLAAGQKQKLEILKQIYLKVGVLILDEPTSVLTPQEADEVLGLLRETVTEGKLSVLIISHKFREVTSFCDEITVLRKGKFAGNGLVKNLSISDMAEMMMGEKRQPKPVEKIAHPNPIPVLDVKNIHANKDNGIEAVKNVNFTVHSGEIVGIAGISGNGQRELVEVLAGQRIATDGKVLVNGDIYTATRAEMYKHKVFSLPEEPLQNACVPHMSVAENLALRTFDRPPQAKGSILLILKEIRQMALGLISTFKIKTPAPETPIGNLSGGNVQRAVLARELSEDHINLLIAANPCFGLDFAAVEYIHGSIIEARNKGVAVLLVSEDLDELLKLADRIFVISEGKLVYESAIADADFNTIGQRMAGH